MDRQRELNLILRVIHKVLHKTPSKEIQHLEGSGHSWKGKLPSWLMTAEERACLGHCMLMLVEASLYSSASPPARWFLISFLH